MDKFNIKIDESGTKVLNVNELVSYIKKIENFDDKEWLINTYQGLRNTNLTNIKPVLDAAKDKIAQMGIELDNKGNFNVTDLDILDYGNPTNDKNIEEVSFDLPGQEKEEQSIIASLPESFDEIVEIDDDYEKVYQELSQKESINSEDLVKLFGCVKHMIKILPELGKDSNEYRVLKSFVNLYQVKYLESSETLNGFVRETIEKFNEIDKELANSYTPRLTNHGAANIVILLEIGAIGLLTVMFLS